MKIAIQECHAPRADSKDNGDSLHWKKMQICVVAAASAILLSGCDDRIERIQSPYKYERLDAVLRFTKGANDEKVDELCNLLLTNASHDVRHACASALGNGQFKRAVPALILALSDEHRDVRRACVVALTRIGDDRSAQPLLAMLLDEEEDIRLVAVRAFQRIKCKDAVTPLTELVEPQNPNNRSFVDEMNEAAIGALAFQGDTTALPILSELLDYPNSKISRAAADAVGSIVGEEFKEQVMISFGFDLPLGSPSKAKAWLKEHSQLMQNRPR
jgi:hypothetical protein